MLYYAILLVDPKTYIPLFFTTREPLMVLGVLGPGLKPNGAHCHLFVIYNNFCSVTFLFYPSEVQLQSIELTHKGCQSGGCWRASIKNVISWNHSCRPQNTHTQPTVFFLFIHQGVHHGFCEFGVPWGALVDASGPLI